MKKLVFRKWLDRFLKIVVILSVLVLTSECSDTKMFLITHVTALVTLTISVALLFKFGRDHYE